MRSVPLDEVARHPVRTRRATGSRSKRSRAATERATQAKIESGRSRPRSAPRSIARFPTLPPAGLAMQARLNHQFMQERRCSDGGSSVGDHHFQVRTSSCGKRAVSPLRLPGGPAQPAYVGCPNSAWRHRPNSSAWFSPAARAIAGSRRRGATSWLWRYEARAVLRLASPCPGPLGTARGVRFFRTCSCKLRRRTWF